MKKLHLLFFVFFSVIIYNSTIAQPPPPGGGGTGSTPNCFPPPCVPIDGGLSWLLIAGTVYGGKKLYRANKEKNEEL